MTATTTTEWNQDRVDEAASSLMNEIVNVLLGAPLTVHSVVGVMLLTYVVDQLVTSGKPDIALALAESLHEQITGTINALEAAIGAQETNRAN